MRRYLDWLAIGERVEAGIEKRRRTAQLNVKGTSQEKRAQGQGHAEPFSSVDEVETSG